MLQHTEENPWTIHEIEALTEEEARTMAFETLTIKGHTVYLVDFAGYFKYSALVFADGMHIYHANQYELHFPHMNGNKELLKAQYIEILTEKLWTEEELTGPLHSYTEYKSKLDYVMNLYPQRRKYISHFFIGSDEERAALQEKIKSMVFCPPAFAYYLREDRDFASRIVTLFNSLNNARDAIETDPAYLQTAIVYEMYNHEYAINWQGNWDVMSCFGNVKYNSNDDPNLYMDQLKWTPEQRSAFWKARAQYYREQEEREESAC